MSAIGSTGDGSEKQMVHHLIHCNSFEEVLNQYDQVADSYEEYFISNDFDAPRLVCEAVLRVYPADGPVPRDQLQVMDIASGTGMVGQKLHDAGVVHIDGLDASSQMARVARARGVYRRVINDTIHGDKHLDIKDNTYDAVTISAGFVKGHLPVTALDEAIRICKPGGYIINSLRYEYLVTVEEYHQLEPHMDKLERLGLWRRVDRFVTDRYFQTVKQGITYIYQKL